ncbi:MAG: VWA domain-containing protein [Planctomycetota bacterium]|nr:VWA domain-containing protein [Planctomycetota bacterium]
MNFAAPLAFGLAALALPILVLYILKIKRRRVSVPYLRLWEELLIETRARSLFQKLKRLYSLLLQLLILISLVFALGQPAFELSSVKKESVVVLLDISASMNALEGENADETRFELMLAKAKELVEGRSYEDEMLIAAVSDRVDVLASFSRDTLRLRDALKNIEPTNRGLDAQGAYAFAREVSEGRENPIILFLSDGGAGAVQQAIGDDGVASLLPIGESKANVGITRFAARKNNSLGTDYVLATFKNFGEETVEVRFEVTVKEGGKPLKIKKVLDVELTPGEEHQYDFEEPYDDGATLHLQLTCEGDRLEVDNDAWAMVRSSRLRKVVVVVPNDSRERAAPVWAALSSMSRVISDQSFLTTTEEYPSLDNDARDADVTVCVDRVPENIPPRGNLILVATPVPDFLPATQKGIDTEPMVWDWDRDHILNRYLNFRDLPLPPARVIDLQAGEALVEGYEGPLIAAFDLPDRRAVYVAFDMFADLFPFRIAFPLLVRNAISWFELEEDVVIEEHYSPGEVIEPLRRVGAPRAFATFFDETGVQVTRKLDVRDGKFYFSETERPGSYIIQIAGIPHTTSVNLFDAGESRIAPDEVDGDALSAEQGRHLLNRDLWTYLALLGLALWALEWFTYHRRLTE